MLKKINNRGDTIVEVLIALAVLSLAFAISYSTANAALIQSQNAQEHSLALEYLDAQIEELRYAAYNPSLNIVPVNEFNETTTNNTSFCLYTHNKKIYSSSTFTYGENNPNPSQCNISGGSFNYHIAITPNINANQQSTFNVSVWWNGLGSLGKQSEQLSYRVYLQ